MSADNGIYILETKDQYRVAHLQAIDNIYWSHINGRWDRPVPTRLVEAWGDLKFVRNKVKALELAYKWAARLTVCEYGVYIITYNKTWKETLLDAKKYANQEIKCMREHDETPNAQLLKITNGEYLSWWLHREKYLKDLIEHDCGYWSVCLDHGCKCAIDQNVNGFDDKVWNSMHKEMMECVDY